MASHKFRDGDVFHVTALENGGEAWVNLTFPLWTQLLALYRAALISDQAIDVELPLQSFRQALRLYLQRDHTTDHTVRNARNS